MKHFNTDIAQTKALDTNGAFFAFSNQQFDESQVKGIKYTALGAGLICPSSNTDALMAELDSINSQKLAYELANNTKKEIIWYELANHEAQITYSTEDTFEAVKQYGITNDDIKAEFSAYIQYCIDNDCF